MSNRGPAGSRWGWLAAVAFTLLCSAANVASAQTRTAVEYYHAGWNFYFVTAFPDEIAVLDGGAFGGVWKRTGQTFDVWTDSSSGGLPSCRFFSTSFSPKSSHFYTPYAQECASLKAGTSWQFEADAFFVKIPDANGQCPAGTEVLYRLYNQGMGGAPNHRLIRDGSLFIRMNLAAWMFEGDGSTAAYACVPVAPPAPLTAEGFWAGTKDDGDLIFGVVLDSGEYFLLSHPPNQPIDGFLHGSGTSVNGTFTSENPLYYRRGLRSLVGTLSGNYGVTTFTGSLTALGAKESFTMSYVGLYDLPVLFERYVGNYKVDAQSFFNIDAAGRVTGGLASQGCVVEGEAVPRGAAGVLNLALQVSGDRCPFRSHVTGIAFFVDAAHTVLIIAAADPAGDYLWYVLPRINSGT